MARQFRNAARNVFFALYALHASTTTWWSTYGVRESRTALCHSSGNCISERILERLARTSCPAM
eukprot:6644452-Lingulodinium_polyedra.AAC.1